MGGWWPGSLASLARGDGSARAYAARYAALLASSLTTSEAAALLDVSEGRVRQRLGEGTLYGVKAGRENRLPAFQFGGGGEVPGIGRVVKAMRPGAHPVAAANFFSTPNPDLYLDEEEEHSLSPRDRLLSGGDPGVLVPLVEEL